MTSSRPCRVEGCSLPKERPSHSCVWHNLLRQPIEHQVAAARARNDAVPEDARLPRLDAAARTPGTRWCAGCQSMPPLFYFAPNATQCRACSSAARHAASIRRDFDLSAAEYDALLLLQGGRCAICRQRPMSQRLAVDHDHQTGEVRGLCCVRCNHDVLGSANDSADRLRAAVHYLEHPPMSGEWVAPTVRPRTRGRAQDRAELDPSYLMYDHDAVETDPFPPVLQAVKERMTVDQLIKSGGRSDPETGVYWLAYRRVSAEAPPF